MSVSSGHGGCIADAYFEFFRHNGGSFKGMRDLDVALPLHRLDAPMIQKWFGDIKDLPDIDQLVYIAEHGAPVHVDGVENIDAALAYSNHNSVEPYVDQILTKIGEDVKFGHAFVFPLLAATFIPGLRLSPSGVVASTSENRVIHDLAFSSHSSGPGVNSDTDFAIAPTCKLGHVLHDVIWRLLYLWRKFGRDARVVLSMMDVASAFRQVAVEFRRSPTFWCLAG